MVKSGSSCDPPSTKREKTWPYDEYYRGDRDDRHRRNGEGENQWTGAESMEKYTGQFLRDTMHGLGDYLWRYKGQKGHALTYEGRFYANQMHGYGIMSYPDGRTFAGLYYNNTRFGPGEESTASLLSNVGLWHKDKLVRLTWQPSTPSVVPNLSAGPAGPVFLQPFRKMLVESTKIIGQTNSAIEVFKQVGADPKLAVENWKKLYPPYCTDINSKLCYIDEFERDYYNNKVTTLEVVPDHKEIDWESEKVSDDDDEPKSYFAWNDTDLIIQMMQHSFKHENQRAAVRLNLGMVLNGPRKRFKPCDKHERDCRAALMASYLGQAMTVAEMVNDNNVHPDIADVQGNTALMYAVAGGQPEVAHFLVEAGANVNAFNDSCCTALGIAILMYLCAVQSVVPSTMTHALLPHASASKYDTKAEAPVTEWFKTRSSSSDEKHTEKLPTKTPSKMNGSVKKMPIAATIAAPSTKMTNTKTKEPDYDSEAGDSVVEDQQEYMTLKNEFSSKVISAMSIPSPFPVGYLFEVNDLASNVAVLEKATKPGGKGSSKQGVSKKSVKAIKSKESVKDVLSAANQATLNNARDQAMNTAMETILQLLSDGADPKLVVCPQPALFMAVLSDSDELVTHLVKYGANLNERYPQTSNYTPLDIAISRPFSGENFDLIKALLENGAETNYRLSFHEMDPLTEDPVPGPNLLHCVVTRPCGDDFDEEIRNQIIQLLLNHNCDPTVQFKGKSALDMAMMVKLDMLNVFMQNRNVNLNSVINDSFQTILVKMFTLDFFQETEEAERFPMITNLLLYGADPFLECMNETSLYGNIFAMAKEVLEKVQDSKSSKSSPLKKESKKGLKDGKKGKNDKKPLKNSKSETKPQRASPRSPDHRETQYVEAVNLMRECARIFHIRWIQGKLMKELIDVVYKYKHRHWSMIYKEHRNPQGAALWLSPERCLEIWDTLKTTKKKLYTDDRILRRLLCIVKLYNNRHALDTPLSVGMTAAEKNSIEADVASVLNEHRMASKLTEEAEPMMKLCVKPELAPRYDPRFNICFECALPIVEPPPETAEKSDSGSKKSNHSRENSQASLGVPEIINFECPKCHLVTFCNLKCLRNNMNRINCHPCTKDLKVDESLPAESPEEGSVS